MKGRENPYSMSACLLTDPEEPRASPGSVSNAVERVLEVRVLGEVTGVIGIL